MKKNLRNLIALIMVIAVVAASSVILTGCGGPATLEEFIDSDENAKTELQTIEKSLGEGGSFTVEGNDITMIYKYSQTFDAQYLPAMKTQIENAMNSMSSTFENMVTQLEEESKLEGITMTVIYQNGDGTEIFSKTYE